MTLRSAVLLGALIILDQSSKFIISAGLQLNESLPILEGIFHITRVHNTGMAFGLFKGMLLVFIFLSVIVMFFIILCANRFRHGYKYLRTGLLFILAGTIGNLADRVRLGYVMDFIDLRVWPVFNIADLTITGGGALLIYHILTMPGKKKIAGR